MATEWHLRSDLTAKVQGKDLKKFCKLYAFSKKKRRSNPEKGEAVSCYYPATGEVNCTFGSTTVKLRPV